MAKTVEQPKLKYNSFAEPNRRREAKEALERFIENGFPVKLVKKFIVHDDLAAIVEMLIEEMREKKNRIEKPYLITNAEFAEIEEV